MVDAVLGGKAPEINDTKTYNNGVKIVPSYLLKPVLVDKSNWHHILIDSAYYKGIPNQVNDGLRPRGTASTSRGGRGLAPERPSAAAACFRPSIDITGFQ